MHGGVSVSDTNVNTFFSTEIFSVGIKKKRFLKVTISLLAFFFNTCKKIMVLKKNSILFPASDRLSPFSIHFQDLEKKSFEVPKLLQNFKTLNEP